LPFNLIRAAETPEVTARVSNTELYFGENLTLSVVEENFDTPVKPDLTPLQTDFTVQEAGTRRSSYNINGVQTQMLVWQYLLTPKRSGNVTIPAITVRIGGKQLSTQPITLRVVAPEKQDLVLTEILVEPATIYPTQPFEVKLRVLVKPLPDQPRRDPLEPLRRRPPELRINWIDPLPEGLTAGSANKWLSALQSRNRTGFSINNIGANDVFAFFERTLALFDLSAGREKRTDHNGGTVNYFAYELKRTFVPQKEGRFTFGPATLKGLFVNGIQGRAYDGRQIYAIAASKTVEVKSVPSPRPVSFCGGIGSYSVDAQASPTTLRVGDPLALTLTFTRAPSAGSLELLSAPDLRRYEALTENFNVADETPTGEVKGETKKFVYTLRPKKSGVSIPALPVAVFDPARERFSEMSTQPIALKVTEASQLKAGDLVAGRPTDDTQGTALRSRAEGIFQNVTSIAQIGNQQVAPRWYLVASIALLLGYAALWAGVLVWRRVASDPVWQRRQAARGTAEGALRKARDLLASGENEEALRALRAALTGLVADMLNLPAAGMTVHEAAFAVKNSGISEAACHEVGRVLDALDALEYGAKSAGELGGALDSAEKLLPVLHKELLQRR